MRRLQIWIPKININRYLRSYFITSKYLSEFIILIYSIRI